MEYEEIKANLEAQLDGVCNFLKQAFCIDGNVTTNGKECIIVGQDGSRLKGVTFVLQDSERGEFMVTLSNPAPMKDEINS